MRGLTPDERYALTCHVGESPTTLRHVLDLRRRGCIELETERELDGSWGYSVTPTGELALRLDAAARAVVP